MSCVLRQSMALVIFWVRDWASVPLPQLATSSRGVQCLCGEGMLPYGCIASLLFPLSSTALFNSLFLFLFFCLFCFVYVWFCLYLFCIAGLFFLFFCFVFFVFSLICIVCLYNNYFLLIGVVVGLGFWLPAREDSSTLNYIAML